jgi:hypothetical protein
MTESQLATELMPAITEVMGLTAAGDEYSTAELVEQVGAYGSGPLADEGFAQSPPPTPQGARSGFVGRVRRWVVDAVSSVLRRARRALRSRQLSSDDDWGHVMWEKFVETARQFRDHMAENARTQVCAVCSQYKSAKEMEGACAHLLSLLLIRLTCHNLTLGVVFPAHNLTFFCRVRCAVQGTLYTCRVRMPKSSSCL